MKQKKNLKEKKKKSEYPGEGDVEERWKKMIEEEQDSRNKNNMTSKSNKKKEMEGSMKIY